MNHQISHLATKLEAGKVLVYNTARKFEAGLPITKEAAMAKYFVSEVTCWSRYGTESVINKRYRC